MRSGRLWLSLSISVLLLVLLVWRADIGGTLRSLWEANYLFVIPGLVFYFVAVLFRTIRWRLLLLPLCNATTRHLFPVVVIGYMANNLLPMRLGELVRSYYVGERENVSKSAALATIAVERVVDGVTLLFVLVAASIFLPVVGLLQDLGRDSGIPWPVLMALAIVPFVSALGLLTILAYRPGWLLLWVGPLLQRMPGGAAGRFTGLIDLFVTGLGVLRQPRRVAAIFALSLPVWLAEAAMYYTIALSFGLQESLGGAGGMAAAMLAVTATSNLATALPSVQGGIGPFEIAATATLAVLGTATDVAAAYALVLHAALLVPVTLLGLIYLWMDKRSLAQMARIGETTLAWFGRGPEKEETA